MKKKLIIFITLIILTQQVIYSLNDKITKEEEIIYQNIVTIFKQNNEKITLNLIQSFNKNNIVIILHNKKKNLQNKITYLKKSKWFNYAHGTLSIIGITATVLLYFIKQSVYKKYQTLRDQYNTKLKNNAHCSNFLKKVSFFENIHNNCTQILYFTALSGIISTLTLPLAYWYNGSNKNLTVIIKKLTTEITLIDRIIQNLQNIE